MAHNFNKKRWLSCISLLLCLHVSQIRYQDSQQGLFVQARGQNRQDSQRDQDSFCSRILRPFRQRESALHCHGVLSGKLRTT